MYHRTETERLQAERIQYLDAKIAHLETENTDLKAALTHQTIEAERSYRDNIGKFDQLSRQVWEEVAYLTKMWKRPISYDEIIKSFQRKYPNVAKAETISRRVRELVEQGWMETPVRGSFIVVKNPNP